ncbi:MAG: hypothetical protein ACRD0A_04215 [Acidimicrobiales bacterium]
MERQLTLIEAPPDWRLDDETKEIGRDGIAQARQALRLARLGARTAQADAA